MAPYAERQRRLGSSFYYLEQVGLQLTLEEFKSGLRPNVRFSNSLIGVLSYLIEMDLLYPYFYVCLLSTTKL